MKAIIIGSGIGGLTAAIALCRVGVEVAIYERAPALAEVGAGISLWANALRALDSIEVGQPVRAACQPLVESQLRVARGHRLAARFSAAQLEALVGTAPVVGMIHRAELVGNLARALPIDIFHFGNTCVDVVQKGERVSVQLETNHGQRHWDDADFVVGADGIRSIVRAQVLDQTPLRYSGYSCFRGVCPRPDSLAAGMMAEWWGRGQRFGITTLSQDRVYWFATHNSPPNTQISDCAQHVRTLFAGWADPVTELLAQTPDDAFLHNDIIDRPPVKTWSRGRIVLLGDAAHATTPNFGQGGCMAIEDGVALAEFVSNSMNSSTADIETALQSFVNFRAARTADVIHRSWRLGRIAQWQSPIACAMRDRMMSTIIALLGPGEMVRFARYRMEDAKSRW